MVQIHGREGNEMIRHTSRRKLWNPWKPRWTLCSFATGMWIRVAVDADNYLSKCTKPLVLLVEGRLRYLREFIRWSCCMSVLGNWDFKPKFSRRRKLKGGEIRKTLRMSGFPKVLFHTEHWSNYFSWEFFCGRILIRPKGEKNLSNIPITPFWCCMISQWSQQEEIIAKYTLPLPSTMTFFGEVLLEWRLELRQAAITLQSLAIVT